MYFAIFFSLLQLPHKQLHVCFLISSKLSTHEQKLAEVGDTQNAAGRWLAASYFYEIDCHPYA